MTGTKAITSLTALSRILRIFGAVHKKVAIGIYTLKFHELIIDGLGGYLIQLQCTTYNVPQDFFIPFFRFCTAKLIRLRGLKICAMNLCSDIPSFLLSYGDGVG